MSLRVRFAPAPTGRLHVGSARTALFNWLLARKAGGSLVLRIEDTDRERSAEAHTAAILDGLDWLGLDWDEGPLFQSHGLARQADDARRLLKEGSAYRDFTTPEQLRAAVGRRGNADARRVPRALAEELGEAEAECRALAGEPCTIRFRVPEGETVWDDLVHGTLRFANADIEDLVLLRSDGSPTYNMAVVSDDADQRITHVIRGDDHVSNTPKQILLYRALGRPVPVFTHLPMILGPDGRRLSKRHGATAVQAYRERGILAEALVNFIALLGWNPGDERELMERSELVEAFSLGRVQRKSAVFDVEKLEWLNGRYLARLGALQLLPAVASRLEAAGREEREERLVALIDLLKVRARTVEELADMAGPYVEEGAIDYEPDAVAKHWAKEPTAVLERLKLLRARLATTAWDTPSLEEATRAAAAQLDVGAGKLIHPLRVAVTGRMHSPGIFDVLFLLGKERSLGRVEDALRRLRELSARVS